MNRTETILTDLGLKWEGSTDKLVDCLNEEAFDFLDYALTSSTDSKKKSTKKLKKYLFKDKGNLVIVDTEKFTQNVIGKKEQNLVQYLGANRLFFDYSRDVFSLTGMFGRFLEQIKENPEMIEKLLKGYRLKQRFAPEKAEKELNNALKMEWVSLHYHPALNDLNGEIDAYFFENLKLDWEEKTGKKMDLSVSARSYWKNK